MVDTFYSKNNKASNFIFLLNIISLFNIIKAEITECSKQQPILISSQCKLEYCSKEQFDLKQCIINNTIVKTQWINNLIIFGENPYRYLSYATYSNDDIVIESACYPLKQKRMFYGLKRDGRPFFINKTNSKETPFYSTVVAGENNKMTESTSTVIKMIDNENNEKEYFLSLSKWGGHAELFDFENDESYVKTLENFTVLSNIKSIKHTFVPLNSENKYLFGFISFHNAENRTYLQKHKFNYLNQFETDISYTNESINEFGTYGYEISCYQAISGCIYCFSLNDVDSELYYYAYKYESDFSNSLNFSIKSSINDEYTFCKCIHLKEEIGVYAYYSNNTGNFNPTILFRQFNVDENKFENFLSSEYVSSEIMITKYSFLNNLLLNDIIKITDNKIAFLATLEDKETLYIIIFNIYGNGDIKVKIRYFSIQLYALYHYKILFDLKLIRYKNILGLGMSFCPDQNCTSDYNEHYSGLILFSYPNSSDTELYLDKFIFDNNINFSNIEIDLTKQLIIENNLFGYILSNIVINNIVNCGDYKLYSSKDESIEIIDYSYLEEDTKIKIKYTGIQNIYPTLNCNIQYFFNAKEPELEIYNDFAEDHEGENEDDLFIRQDYPGRLSYYKIILNKELTTSCDNNNCDLCLNGQNSYCLTCKYNFDLNNEAGEIRKICYDKFTEHITVITDSDSTNNDNDNINFCTNEEIINNKCVEK